MKKYVKSNDDAAIEQFRANIQKYRKIGRDIKELTNSNYRGDYTYDLKAAYDELCSRYDRDDVKDLLFHRIAECDWDGRYDKDVMTEALSMYPDVDNRNGDYTDFDNRALYEAESTFSNVHPVLLNALAKYFL